MKISADLEHTGIRFSLSRYTTEQDIEETIQAIKSSVSRLREISIVY